MHLYPLTRANRLRVARSFATVPRVDISIECVLEDQMGTVYVDDLDDPAWMFLEQDHFFAYLAGDFRSEAGRAFLQALPQGRFLMTGNGDWAAAAQEVWGAQLQPIQRYRYASDSLSLAALEGLLAANPHSAEVKRIDLDLASMSDSPLELGAFESPADFLARGIGFCLLREGKIIGVAYSSLVCSHAIEVSIFVLQDYTRQGIASALACHLLHWCLTRQIDPHWDAANLPSCGLAEKLGYRPLGAYTAYFLKPAT